MEYKSENKICQNCKGNFVTEPDDFSFYEKMQVPAPTWCPKCRMMRRTSFRSVRSLYKRNCDLCNKSIVTMYHSDDPAPVYCNTCWQGDAWDPISYGMDIDWSRPFLEQWHELLGKVPRFALWQVPPLENCEYTNYSISNKNCYLSYSVTGCEDVRYCENIDQSKNSLDNLWVNGLENCYENVDSLKNYNSKFIIQSRDCIDSWFLFDCVNCQSCFMSSNLRNQQFVFRGKQLTKDAYQKAVFNEKTGSFQSLENLKKEFYGLIENKAFHKYADIVNSPLATGNHIQSSKNIKNSFGVSGSENMKNSMRVLKNSRDSQDIYGLAGGELIYDCVAVSYDTNNCAFGFLCNTSMSNARYIALCLSSDNIFGCVGLKKKDYCILNKEYSKEEYLALVPKLINHMNALPYFDTKGRKYSFGEFFPIEFSPHSYNEAVAFDIFPITKSEALGQGYRWKEKEVRDYSITTKAQDLPDLIEDVPDSVISEVINCAHNSNCDQQCTTAFRISSDDIAFYRRFNLPLPRLCPNCRHYERLAKREPIALWHRSCMCDIENHGHNSKCQNEFETSYAPERPEKVYCEDCYKKEVY